MTSTTNHFDGVLVAVDGSEQDCSVVRDAVTEAERLGAPGPTSSTFFREACPAPMGMPMIPELSFESCGAQILANAKEAALDAVATLEVGTHLSLGRRIQQLLAFAAHSQLIVSKIAVRGVTIGSGPGAQCTPRRGPGCLPGARGTGRA